MLTMYLNTLVQLLLVFSWVNCDALKSQHFFKSSQVAPSKPIENQFNVAIIGSGASGSSSAYFLTKYFEKNKGLGLQVTVDVFEKESEVGGRVYSVNLGEDKFELGANAFVDVNYNLMNATKEFNISFEENGNRSNETVGFYDGKSIVSSLGMSYFSNLYFYYQYGISFYQAKKFANLVKTKFLTSYDENFPTFHTMKEFLELTHLKEYFHSTLDTQLDKYWNVGSVFRKELLQAITKNIYATDSDKIQGLAGAIALIAASGSFTTVDGNQRFYQNYLDQSKAKVHLNSTVTNLSHNSNFTKYQVEVHHQLKPKLYDAVILATPLDNQWALTHKLPKKQPEVQYRQVEAYLVTQASLNPNYFNLSNLDEVPDTVFGFAKELPYSVINYDKQNKIVQVEGNSKFDLEELNKLLLRPYGKVIHKSWLAYPIMDFELDKQLPEIVLQPNLYYPNAFEAAISTMETSILAANNVVKLITEKLHREKQLKGEKEVCGKFSLKEEFIQCEQAVSEGDAMSL